MNFTERQIEILNASKELIGTKGLQNLTIKNLADKMNFSEPALYRHFKDKTEIISALLIYHKENITIALKSKLKNNKSTLENFRSLVHFYFAHINKNPELVMIVFSETSFQYCSVLSSIVNQIMNERMIMIIDLLQKGQINNEIRSDVDTKELARIIQGSIRATILAWRLGDFKSDLLSDGKKVWDTLDILLKS